MISEEVVEKYKEELKKILEYEGFRAQEYATKVTDENQDFVLGWEWHDVGVPPSKLRKLVEAGVLRIVHKSNRHTVYRLVSPEIIKKLITEGEAVDYTSDVPVKTKMQKGDLFKHIVGYEDVKQGLLMAIESNNPVHVLLIGPPATAKSLFLEDLYRYYSRAEFVIGSQASKAGISKLLMEKKPEALIIDEIDKILKSEDLSVLLSLMETGEIRRVKGDRITDVVKLNTKVFAAGNTDNLPRELKSRFLVLYLPEYTREQFIEVTTQYLVHVEGAQEDVARYIAEQVWGITKDVRTARHIFRLAGNDMGRINFVLSLLRKYNRR